MLGKIVKTSIGLGAAGALAAATVAKCTAEVIYNNRGTIADKAMSIISEARDNAEFALSNISKE